MPRFQEISAYDSPPEPDNIEGFSSPRVVKRIYGHETAEEEFLNSYRSNRVHHAWIVAGTKGIGKATLVYHFTRYLLASENERVALRQSLEGVAGLSTSRLIANLAHPDLIVLRRPFDYKTNKLKTEISIDEARKLKNFLSLGKTLGSSKVVIVDPADDLNLNAANAILKSIEEPISQTFFFLITSAPEKLLPTIRSRCRILRCRPLSSDDLKKALIQAFNLAEENIPLTLPLAEDWKKLVLLSEGSVGRALTILTLNGINLYTRLIGLFSQLPQCNFKEIHSLADDLVSQSSEIRYDLFVELFFSILSRLITSATKGSYEGVEGQIASRLIKNSFLQNWAEVSNTLIHAKADVETYNLDKRAMVLRLFQELSVRSLI